MPVRKGLVTSKNVELDGIIRKLEEKNRKFLIVNFRNASKAIVYCSIAFCNMCGYNRFEIRKFSCTCEFLYGDHTSKSDINLFRDAVCEDSKTEIREMCLYKKDGTRFHCKIIIAPVKNKHGDVMMLIINFEPFLENKGNRRKSIRRLSTVLRTPLTSSNRILDKLSNHKFAKNRRYSENNVTAISKMAERVDVLSKSVYPQKASSEYGYAINTDRKSPHHSNKTIRKASTFTVLHDENNASDNKSCHLPLPFPIAESSSYPMENHRELFSRRHSTSLDNIFIEQAKSDKSLLKPTFSLGSVSENDLTRLRKTESKNFDRSSLQPRSSFVEFIDRLAAGENVAPPEKLIKNNKVTNVLSFENKLPTNTTLQSPKIQKFTILHYGLFKVIWDWLILLLIIYTAIVTPFVAAFLLQFNYNNHFLNGFSMIGYRFDNPLSTLEFFVDIFFIIDILINFRTTYVNKKDEVVSESCKIAFHYFKGWFVIDFIAAIPFDLLIVENTQQAYLIGLLKTVRLLRLVRVVRKLDRYSEFGSAILILLMCLFALIAHWLACLWYAIGNLERPFLEDNIGWLGTLAEQLRQPYNDTFINGTFNSTTGGPSTREKYVTALYFIFSSLTGVGFGNVSPNTQTEKILSIIVMLIGSLMYAIIFGNVSALMQRLYSGTARYHSQMRRVREFIRFYRLPDPLKQRIEEYFQHSWNNTNGIDMGTILKGFPECLQADICLYLNRQLLENCPVLSDATPGCQRMLSMKFKTTHVPPGDTLVHRGDVLRDLYFITRGSIEILNENEELMFVITTGDVFGERMFDSDIMGKSKYTVRALTYCEFHRISRNDLFEVLKNYPNYQEKFWNKLVITFDLSSELGFLKDVQYYNFGERRRYSEISRDFQIDERDEIDYDFRTSSPTVQLSPTKTNSSSCFYSNYSCDGDSNFQIGCNDPNILQTSYQHPPYNQYSTNFSFEERKANIENALPKVTVTHCSTPLDSNSISLSCLNCQRLQEHIIKLNREVEDVKNIVQTDLKKILLLLQTDPLPAKKISTTTNDCSPVISPRDSPIQFCTPSSEDFSVNSLPNSFRSKPADSHMIQIDMLELDQTRSKVGNVGASSFSGSQRSLEVACNTSISGRQQTCRYGLTQRANNLPRIKDVGRCRSLPLNKTSTF